MTYGERNRTCPQCCGVPEPAVAINILFGQMKVLRDELVSRDRLLREAQAEIEQLRSRRLRLRRPLFTSRDP
jgi:hypothetical protein